VKFKPTKSLESVKSSITEHVVGKSEYLFVANLEGEWNMLIVIRLEPGAKSSTSKIIEKFSEQVIDYRINKLDIQNVNLLNMSLLLL
jgi:Lrp/AsnC family leucine-responsive transcriptional regulator